MPLSPSNHSLSLGALRAEVEAIALSQSAKGSAVLPFGVAEIDRHMANGGLALGALHELTAASNSLNDDAAATLFAAGIAARAMGHGGTVLWVMRRRDLFAPALAQAGVAPERLIYAECSRDEDVLAVMEELRAGGLSAVVGEVARASMTATRRLQLAAENSGTMVLMLRAWRRWKEDPLAAPSAATTRWRLGCVPSRPLPVPGIARPRWHVELVRQRGGQPHSWIMEGVDEAGCLALPAEPEHRPAAPGRARAAA